VQRLKYLIGRLLRRKQAETALDEEIRAHLAIEERQRIESGEPPDAARLAALKDFGSPAGVKEATRESWGTGWLDRVGQDIRYGMRTLWKAPTFTLLAVSALALGIGATTAMFALIYSIVLRPLPFVQPDQLVMLHELQSKTGSINVVSFTNFKAWTERAKSFHAMAAYQQRTVNLIGGTEAVQVRGAAVTGRFFQVFRVNAELGRTFVPEEGGPPAARVVVLSHGFWQRQFGGRRDIIGSRIRVDGAHHEVIGVLPASFDYPSKRVELFIPVYASYSGRDFLVVARLRENASLSAARDELAAIAAQTARENPGLNAGWSASATPLQEQIVGRTKPVLGVLFAAVGFILLIACANVANLLLMRSAARQRDLSLRLALGASRWRVIQQIMIQSLLLAVCGGAVGIVLAHWSLKALIAIPSWYAIPRLDEISIDPFVALFAAGVALLTGVVFGLAPALSSWNREISPELRTMGRTVASGDSRFRKLLMAAEVAIALPLLIGAGLLISSFQRISEVDPGFRPERLLTVRMSLLPGKLEARAQFVNSLLDRLRSLPQVTGASAVNILPMLGISSTTWFYRADRPEPPLASRPGGDISIVASGYFQTMGIALLQGRDFDRRDKLETPQVGIMNQAAANLFFPNEDPVGKRLDVSWGTNRFVEIVGVVSDIRQRSLNSTPRPCLFLVNTQQIVAASSLVIRTTADPLVMTAAIREEVRKLDPDQGIAEMQTMEKLIAESNGPQRGQMMLLSGFAVLALALACIGVYGVISFSVGQRSREIGIRITLGAKPATVFRGIVTDALRITAAGMAVGYLLSVGLTRQLETMLYEVRPLDAPVFAGVGLMLVLSAFAACFLPARRATQVDPAIVLREE
jgi:predicted permease